MNTRNITETFTVSEQIHVRDVDAIADAGYSVVICNRPDAEDAGQPDAAEIAAACAALGLEFHHLPFSGPALPAATVDAFRAIVDDAPGPVFAYCRSGQRCTYLWARAML